MEDEIEKIEKETVAAIEAASSASELHRVRVQYLGRSNGALTLVLRKLGSVSLEERKKIGPAAQALKEKLEQLCDVRESQLLKEGSEVIDNTLPPLAPKTGHLHPLTHVRWQLEDLFTRMGFIIADGPEVESEWYNFDALNMPSWHPARDMQDTFYVETQNSKLKTQKLGAAAPRLVLRTHTSPVQIRAMEKFGVPLRCIIPGVCYRNEATDARHENSFWQIEGLVIDRDISMAHLNATVRMFLKELFGAQVEARVRPGFFPFTEPSVEYDISCQICGKKGVIQNGARCRVCKGTGWLEFMGAGLVHPTVLKNGGVDPKKYSGFAFGFGPARLVMMKYGIDDNRLFWSGDLRFLTQCT
ncbi:MAG: phenylalanine--tRNA ligase subunit alpha [Patescibacteria group bacterium]